MGNITVQTAVSVALQIVLTGIVGWLVHKITMIKTEFREFMAEHEFLLKTAKDNSAAIIKLNRRLDRMARNRG